ncbi:hypothetical protein CHS0354_014069 [Potamilus streckersoni]|uniref:Uncharacterized protein n=1 Tax=Potamilus streckersoni TaxID=2493646 RepID=A0AAE0SME1_9BIVA|nr:hypothetical protein CHS0354_014069 [Potamilus streckersoni]
MLQVGALVYAASCAANASCKTWPQRGYPYMLQDMAPKGLPMHAVNLGLMLRLASMLQVKASDGITMHAASQGPTEAPIHVASQGLRWGNHACCKSSSIEAPIHVASQGLRWGNHACCKSRSHRITNACCKSRPQSEKQHIELAD